MKQLTYIPNYPVTRTKDPKGVRTRKVVKEDPLALVREANNRSLFHFIQVFWSEISNDEFKPNWHIEYICKELERIAYRVANNLPKEKDAVINVPPGTTKTIMISIMFPIWCWTKWYWMRFITASYSGILALESAEYSRDLMRSSRFRMLYPELVIKGDKDTKTNFKVVKLEPSIGGHRRRPKQLHGGNRYSTSVGGTLTGFHGHILIVDDPLNPEQAVSPVEIATANRWVDQTLSTRKTDKTVSATITVMQRVHENDPSGHMLKKRGGLINHICLPGEIRTFRDVLKPPSLARYYKDDLLDPVRLDWTVLKEMEKTLGQYGYAGQVGQTPTSAKGGMFKIDRLISMDRFDPVNAVSVIRYWDKAGSAGKGAYTVGVKMARTLQDKIIIMDVKRGQWSSEVREAIILATAEADGPEVKVYVEQEPGSGGKESAEATIRRLGSRGFSCYADSPRGDKVFRADPFSVRVNLGDVAMVKGDWNKAYTDEMTHFPVSTYKDQIDASSGGYAKLVGKRKARSR